MTRSDAFSAVRLAVLGALLVIPLLGCIFGPNTPALPAEPESCDAAAAGWTPERIELLDMADMASLEEDPELDVVFGGQGSDMAGVFVVVYGDDIPGCLDTSVGLGGDSRLEQWTYEADGPRRAQTSSATYWVAPIRGDTTVTVTIGEMTVTQDVTVF